MLNWDSICVSPSPALSPPLPLPLLAFVALTHVLACWAWGRIDYIRLLMTTATNALLELNSPTHSRRLILRGFCDLLLTGNQAHSCIFYFDITSTRLLKLISTSLSSGARWTRRWRSTRCSLTRRGRTVWTRQRVLGCRAVFVGRYSLGVAAAGACSPSSSLLRF